MEALAQWIAQQEGKTISVAVEDLESGREICIHADVNMHPASTMKVPVMVEVFRQAQAALLGLDERLPLDNAFKSIVDGSVFALESVDDSDTGLYQRLGETESIHELTRLMIVRSSNLATNLLIERLGCANVDACIKNLGIEHMHVLRGLEDKKAYRLGLNNSASARAATRLMALIAQGKVVSPSASRAMTDILLAQEFNQSIPAGVPAGVAVAHKTGWTSGYFHDTGIVYPPMRKPYALSIFTQGFPEDQDHLAHRCMAEISRMIFWELQSAA